MAAVGLWLLGMGRAVVGWLSRRSLMELIAIGLSLVCLVQFATIRAEKRHSAKLSSQLQKSEAARRADRTSYETAQSQAAEANKAQVAKVERQQQDITDEVTRNLNARLAALREQLRAQAGTPQGSAHSAGSSAVPGSATGAPGQAGVCLAPEQLLRAAENEERHDQLIQWVERQLKVDPNK